jgi:hypothetical protein
VAIIFASLVLKIKLPYSYAIATDLIVIEGTCTSNKNSIVQTATTGTNQKIKKTSGQSSMM